MLSESRIDHLVIGALTLEEGVEYVRKTLGVDIPPGGSHSALATHNHLMAIGEDVFLEVIAADHAAKKTPERLQQPRWYGLDDPYVQAALHQSPALLAWVINTRTIDDMAAACSWPLGNIVDVTRGELSWRFALPFDGALPAAGMLPYAIEWDTSVHPARNMADCGIRLEKLEISHPNAKWLKAHLASVNADTLVTIRDATDSSTPVLSATFSSADNDSADVEAKRITTLHSPITQPAS